MQTIPDHRTGHCLCGAVKLEVELAEAAFDACHCGMCRRWHGGGPGLGINLKGQPKVAGAEHVTVYTSSEWAERAFCKTCGTHLYYRMKDGSFVNLCLGVLDSMDGLAFTTQIFVDCKPEAYAFANSTKMMTEAQVLAMFGGGNG
jgi:hypothetical protein